MTNRKLKRNVVFEGRCYMQYQKPIIEWYMEKFNCNESEALSWYIKSGLAKKFEEHHKPKNNINEIKIFYLGQKIN